MFRSFVRPELPRLWGGAWGWLSDLLRITISYLKTVRIFITALVGALYLWPSYTVILFNKCLAVPTDHCPPHALALGRDISLDQRPTPLWAFCLTIGSIHAFSLP